MLQSQKIFFFFVLHNKTCVFALYNKRENYQQFFYFYFQMLIIKTHRMILQYLTYVRRKYRALTTVYRLWLMHIVNFKKVILKSKYTIRSKHCAFYPFRKSSCKIMDQSRNRQSRPRLRAHSGSSSSSARVLVFDQQNETSEQAGGGAAAGAATNTGKTDPDVVIPRRPLPTKPESKEAPVKPGNFTVCYERHSE